MTDQLDSARIQAHHQAGTITEREREALHLHHVKHMSYRQIALGLNLAVSTVTDRVNRAHQKIRIAERNAA